MGDRPTFSVSDDYVALLELKPAARTVYGLLRCNAVFGRNGVAQHSVHVTSSWFTEMTAHWESPITAPTARRGLNELIDKGVLVRINEPQDGTGFVVAFVVDPGPHYEGPVNGFEHAEKVSKRCGTRAFYQRKDERPGTPAVTGSRLDTRRSPAGPGLPQRKPPAVPAPATGTAGQGSGLFLEGDPENAPLKPEFEEYGSPEEADRGPAAKAHPDPAPEVNELAHLLVQKCHGKGLNRQGLLDGEALRIAESCTEPLKQGWRPDQIAARLSALVSDKIHSTEAFLTKKAGDLGTPPAAPRNDGTVLVKGQQVDLGVYSWGDIPGSSDKVMPEQAADPLPPSSDDQATRERLAKLARHTRRSR